MNDFDPGLLLVIAVPVLVIVAILMHLVRKPDRALDPIDMVLFCPDCGHQHIDGVEVGKQVKHYDELPGGMAEWTNPPHRSHLCHNCGYIWRPADVPTNGVAAITTKGSNDKPAPMLAAMAVPCIRERATQAGAANRRYRALADLRNEIMEIPWLSFKRQVVIERIENTWETLARMDEEEQP
ncbi:hypothetical protein D3C87_687680 [compost metagenome]